MKSKHAIASPAALAAIGLMVLACQGPEIGTEQRVPGGKADDGVGQQAQGSCQGICGDRAQGGCYCDSYCVVAGDCCADHQTYCVESRCQGITCELPPAVCDDDGTTLKTPLASACDEITGQCETTYDSEPCAHGCADGQCLPPPCGTPWPAGVSLQQWIDTAADGATLDLGDGPITANVTIEGKRVTLVGNCDGAPAVFRCANTKKRAITAGEGADVTIEGFIFEGCDGGTGQHYSGVIHLAGAKAVRARDSVFRANSAHRGAVMSTWKGASMAAGGLVLIEDCVIHDNRANDAAAIYIAGRTKIQIRNTLIFGNRASDYSAAVWLRSQQRGDLVFEKNVVYGNTASRAAALATYSGEGPSINSCIVAGNGPSQLESSWTSRYSTVGADPGFVDPSSGDFRLQTDSPAIDAGDPSLPTDADGTITDQGVAFDGLPAF